MNSIGAIAFVIFATIVGKWLLFDDDRPVSGHNDIHDPRRSEPRRSSESRADSKSSRQSKSA